MLKIVIEYAKGHLKSGLLFLSFAIIYAIIFMLFSLPVAAVIYGGVVCLFVFIIAVSIDFWGYYKRHLELQRIKKQVEYSIDNLPFERDLLKRDYSEIVRAGFADKLYAASKAEERYSSMMEYFTLWAHQIKTPIAAMRLVLQSEDTEDNRELLSELFRIEQYVEMVLCYLRLDEGVSDLIIKECDLDNIVRQAIRKYSSQFIRKRLRLEYRGISCRVLTDEKWLSFVIEQLLSNAIKYTSRGEIRIYLEEPKVLVIEDTGIGIAPEDLPRIFEKGYTGYNGRQDRQSTGIGLYLCKRICRRLSHKIAVESQVGKGTRVTIDLSSLELELRYE